MERRVSVYLHLQLPGARWQIGANTRRNNFIIIIFFIIVLFSAFIGDAGTKAPAHQLRFRSCTVLFRVHNAYFDFDCFSGSNVQQQQ